MKTEFLKGFGLSDEDIQKILAENGKDVEREKAKTSAALEEIETLKSDKQELETKITELTEKSGTADEYKSQLEKLKADIAEKEKADKAAKADSELTAAIEAVFGDKKFTSDYVRNGIIADMKSEIAKPENKGKGYAKIFESLTKDKEGIFANPNPPAGMPGMGGVDTNSITKEQFRKMGYKAKNELYKTNKPLYEQLVKEE
ncbi:MAG: phage scaffolding protein [Clostridia bacterium]|nr:phage scaffolding protein [Clostridia bacterium]